MSESHERSSTAQQPSPRLPVSVPGCDVSGEWIHGETEGCPLKQSGAIGGLRSPPRPEPVLPRAFYTI